MASLYCSKRTIIGLISGLVMICAAGCVYYRVQVKPLPLGREVAVRSPVKAHLKDGSTIVYSEGMRISAGSVSGKGVRYDLALRKTGTVDQVPLDSIVGMESFQTRVDAPKTAIVTALATAGAVVGTALLAVAIFGSCPTVYSEGGVEEAELFSNSIAPILEGRDVDRLQSQPGNDGALTLEILNEALETHYINHLQLMEVPHATHEYALPDPQGHPVVVRELQPPPHIVARDGNTVTSLVAVADGRFYKTDRRRVEGATPQDLNDWIDLTAPVPQGASSTTLVFRLRNSLLSTTLLYDVMLAPAGARALDWLGDSLSRISTAVELGRWHQRMAGLHIQVYRDGAYREVMRIPDSGPIAWHEVAAVLPTLPGENSLKVRLSFLADHWRIDRIGVAGGRRDPAVRLINLSQVRGSGGRLETAALDNLRTSDDRYLQTNPGDRFSASFPAGGVPGEEPRTFLLASQGYYTEWIRGDWIKTATATEPFQPTDEAVVSALKKWAATGDSFEARFLRDRVPTK